MSLVADIRKRSLNTESDKSEQISHVPREKNSELKSRAVADFQTNQSRPMPNFLADLQGATYGDNGACPTNVKTAGGACDQSFGMNPNMPVYRYQYQHQYQQHQLVWAF